MKHFKHGLYLAMAEEARVVAKTLNFTQCKKDVWPFSEAFVHEDWQALMITGGQADFDGHKISRVGKAAAAQMTALLISHVKPKWVWNVGTCGGITDLGAGIGDVYTGAVQQHDMHTPLDLVKRYVERQFITTPLPGLAERLPQLKTGLISTGDAFDKHERDWRHIHNCQAPVVEMEAFAVADVVNDMMGKPNGTSIPLVLLKGVTDTITLSRHHEHSIHEAAKDFAQNLKTAMQNVATAVRLIFENKILDHK